MKHLARLRMTNAVLAAAMIVLFAMHGVGNSFELFGVGMPTSKMLARAVATLAVVHAVLGVVLTLATVRAQRKAGVSYVRLNKRFWAIRLSGLALAVFVVFHMMTFLQVGGGAYRLREFGGFELATNLGLVLCMAVHVLCSARPLAISLGINAPRSRAADLVFALSLVLLVTAAAFVVYYLRWDVI
ncbi:MAG: hypothetical protein IKG22_03480 [Atopobiaceae bacterium]|nr:hypothetical protein [Atopobiaceae bacterium]